MLKRLMTRNLSPLQSLLKCLGNLQQKIIFKDIVDVDLVSLKNPMSLNCNNNTVVRVNLKEIIPATHAKFSFETKFAKCEGLFRFSVNNSLTKTSSKYRHNRRTILSAYTHKFKFFNNLWVANIRYVHRSTFKVSSYKSNKKSGIK